MSIQFIAIESATGDVYQVAAQDEDAAYRVIARDVLKMSDWDVFSFDTGNVDFDLIVVKDVPHQTVEKVWPT